MGSFDPGARLLLDGCEIDVAQCELVRGTERQHLTTKEVEVLTYFARNPSRSISHEELLEQVWGHSRLASTQPVYSVLKRLRRKLDGHGPHRHLHTVHGVGYRFEPARGAAEAPPMRASSLPKQTRVSSFIGRESELARIDERFLAGARIVSLVGPGGAGKTRVAFELSLRWAERGLDVIACDLSAALGAEDVRRAIAVAVGARPSEEDDEGSDPIARALRSRPIAALLLDNAEHLLDVIADVALGLAPIVRMLVTSRERLSVPGEHVVEVGALQPEDGDRLFRERARAAGAVITGDTVVADIVLRLDGLPLAIEIAAAHASSVSLDRTRADLDRQIDRLLATRRGVPARQATLRSSVEWSWSLLHAAEREVLAQCVVFSGGFTLDAAEAVVAASGSVRQHVLALTERSLLRPLAGSGREGRFAPYECVRELAAERLEERTGAEARHTRWALALASSSGALDDVPPPRAYAELAPEVENLTAAFRRALAHQPDVACDLALAIDLVTARARGSNAANVLSLALGSATGARAVRLRLALGRSLQHAGAQGLSFLDDTCALAAASGTPQQALEAERLASACLSAIGDPRAAFPRLEAALARARALSPDGAIVGRLALDLAETHLAAGSVARASELATEAARILEAGGEHAHAARAAGVLSHVHRENREHEDGLAALERARRLLEEAGDEVALARLELDRGVLLAHLARSSEAEAALAAATLAHHRLGLVTGEIRARDWMVLVLLGLGRDEDALAEAREIQQLGIDLGRPVYEADRAFGATWLVTGKLDEADAAFGRALDVLAAGGKETVRGHVLSARALGRIALGRLADAALDLEECARIHEARGSTAARLHSLAELALVRELLEERDDTAAILDEAAATLGSPWERRHAAGRRAVLEIVRARRAGRSASDVEALVTSARAALLGGAAEPSDYFTRCTLLLIEHVGRTARAPR